MKEFDKIYIAKYKDVLTTRQIAEDLRTSQIEISNSIDEMKDKGILEIYKSISDWEWEKLERLNDNNIKCKYYTKSEKLQKKIITEIFEKFKAESIHEVLMKFDKYNYKKEDFNIDYM